MKRTMRFSVGGQTVDVPEDELNDFNAAAQQHGATPDEIRKYRVEGQDVDVPQSQYAEFAAMAKERGATVTPLHTVSMDDGATLNLSQEAVRQFVQARQTGMPMSRTLLANTGIPDIYAHSRAEREALADKFALMFPPEEPRQDYLPRERNLGDTISEGIDALRTSPTVAGAVGAVKGFVEGAVTNAGEAIDDFYGDSILGNALKGAGDFANAATKSILHTAATAIGGRDTEWGRALLSASESLRTDSANMETGNETANAILGFAKDFNQNTLPTIAKLAVPGVAAVDIAGSVVDGYYDAYNEAIRNGASPDKANALASAKAGIAAAEGLWLAKSAGAKEAINGIKGIIAGSLRMGGKMAVTGAAGDVVQHGIEGSKYGLRADGKTYKGTGWLGELKTADGGVATEYTSQSEAVKVDGKRIDFPTLVPTLTKDEINLMVNDIIPNHKPVPDEIMQKAVDHANMQLKKGESVFANDGEPIRNPDIVRALKAGLKSGAEGALFELTAKGLHAVAGAGDRKAASEARRAVQEREEAAAKETAREEARTRYEANLSDEAVADIDATIAKQVEAGTIPSWRHAEEVKRRAIEKLGGRENGESHEAVEQSIIEAAGEVNERLNTPDRVESAALERRKAEYEQKMAAYEEARAKRAAEKKRFGRAKTELPEKPTPPELRVEKSKKPVIEADLTEKPQNPAEVDKKTTENSEKVPDGRGKMVETPQSLQSDENGPTGVPQEKGTMSRPTAKESAGSQNGASGKTIREKVKSEPHFYGEKALSLDDAQLEELERLQNDYSAKLQVRDRDASPENEKAWRDAQKKLYDFERKHNGSVRPVYIGNDFKRVPDGKGRMVKKAEGTAQTAKAEGGQKRTAATSDELKPLKDAIAEAKKIAVEKPRFGTSTPTKTFEAKVGTTTIKFGNTEEGIAAAEKMAKKLSVVKDWMPKTQQIKSPSAPKPLKVAKGKDVGTFDDVAPDFFAGKKDWRSELKAPIVKDGYIYATDGHTLIRMKADIEAKNTDGAPDVKKVFEMAVGSPTEKFKIDASKESIPLEQARAATNKDYKGVEIWRSPEGKIVMRAKTSEDTSESSAAFLNTSSLKNHDFIGKFDPDYIEKAFKTFAKLGVKDVDVEWKDPTKALYLRGGGAEVLVMPMHGGILEADAKVQMLGGRRRMTDAQRAEIVDQQVADAIAKAKEKDPKLTQKRINEIEEQIRDSEKLAQEEIGKHKGNLDPMLSPDKPLGERVVDSAAELDRLIAEEESAAPSSQSAEGLPSRSYSWKSGSGVGGIFPRLVSKNSIVRKMKELFPEFAIRGENTTKIGASYAGHFEPWRELIRSKDMASIDTIPHEIGHGISMRTKRKAMNIPQEAKRELAKFGRQLYGDKKPNGGYMEEGFAEYVRGYMTGAENLAAEAPALDRWFNNTFAKVNPEYVEKMRQIRLEVQRYRQQSDMQKVAAFMKPDNGRISRIVDAVKSFFSAENWNDTNATLTRGIKDSGMSRMFEWRQDFRDLEKAMKEGRTADADALRKSIDEKIASDPRIFASNSRGTSKSRVMDAFENGVTDIEGFGKIGNVVGWKADGTPIRDNNTESVRDIFKSFSRKELADWDKYAIAKVGLENYINEGREFGLDRSVCENIVRDLESPKFENALKRFTDFTRRGVSVGLESGAMSKSDYEAMTGAHKYYVRIERRLAPDGAGIGGAQQNPFHKIKGSSKNILNPRAATMIQMERQIRFFQAAKLLNLIGKATLRAEKANADFAKGVGNEEYQVAANMPLRVANAQEAVNFTSEKLKEDFKKRASQAFEDNGQAQPGVMTTRRGKLMTEAQSMALDLYDSMYGEDGSKLTIFREKPSNGKNGLVSTYIDGKLVTFELPDAKWSKFVTGMEDDALFNSKGAQTAWKIATAPSRTLKLGATLINTAFTTANVTRDTQHAAVTSESRQIPVVNIAQGLYDILYSKKTSALFKQMGGEAALFAGSSKERQYENAARVASANTLFKKVGASLYNPIHATTGAISSVLSVPEMAPRVREMAGVMKKAQDAGLSYETAARLGFAAAKEVSLDFGKHGQYMRYLNDIIPYTNAWYRGLEQLSRKFGITEELPTSFEERRGVKAKNTVGKGLLFLTLPAIATTIAKMAMSDDEEREAIFKKTPREKWDFDDSLGVRLAQPFELGAIFHAMPKAMVYEAYGDKGAVKEALWHGIESNIIRYKDPADFARGMSLISPWLDIAMNEKWDDSPIVSPFIKENMPKSEWKDYSTTDIASWLGEKMDWAPAYIDHVANSYTGGMWKRWLSPAADNSLMTLTGLSTFRPRPTARRDVGDFYGFAEETRRKYNGGKASPDEVGRLRRAEKLKDDLSGDFKEARNLNNAGISTDERNKRREEIMFRIYKKIRDWDKAEVSDRDIGIRKAVDAISAKEVQNAEKSTLDKNFSVIKGISLGELEYHLREYGREYVPDGKGKMRRRWTKDTVKKRVRNLYNAIQLMD